MEENELALFLWYMRVLKRLIKLFKKNQLFMDFKNILQQHKLVIACYNMSEEDPVWGNKKGKKFWKETL